MASQHVESSLSDQILISNEGNFIGTLAFISDFAIEKMVRRLVAGVDGDTEFQPYRKGKTNNIESRAWKASIYLSIRKCMQLSYQCWLTSTGPLRMISHVFTGHADG